MASDSHRLLLKDPLLHIKVQSQKEYSSYPSELRKKIDTHWEKLISQGRNLFDGKIFSILSIVNHEIIGQFIPYRCYVAWKECPALRDELSVRPFCVSGITFSDHRILVGKRAAGVYNCPGMWEFVPSGGVDEQCLKGSHVDLEELILRELEEEMGIHPDHVEKLKILALAEDTVEQGVELIYSLKIGDENFSAIKPFLPEYSEAKLVAFNQIEEFLRKEIHQAVPFSHFLWQIFADSRDI